jgi:hypothetical protein
MITEAEIDLLRDILKWLENILSFEEKYILKRENYLINSSEESIVTLILKYRDSDNPMDLIKKSLLQNMTTDFGIALRHFK